MEKNPKKSWVGLEADIGYWCSACTIRKWLLKQETFSYYTERILPNLLPHQKVKHKDFAHRFRYNWGMGGGIYLLIEFDKKWMWGLVVRRYAKSCAKLGLTKKYFKAYHRNHINKVMMTAFTGLAFEDNIENGGEAIKLGLFRAQSYKVAEKEVREGVRQADGTMRMTGPVKRRRDDLYLVDCAVTGSSDGTSKDPKCSLQ